MTRGARILVAVAVGLFLASVAATVYFITREIRVEQRVIPKIQQIGSPCRSAKQEALSTRDRGETYWEAVRRALMDSECREQSDLVIWSYCVRHDVSAIQCDLPEGLRPDRPPDDGDRKGGDADQSPPNTGTGQPPPGSSGPGGTGIHIPPHGGSHSPSQPVLPGPATNVLDEVQDAVDEVTKPVCQQAPMACDLLP